ncbi:hypothetical protein V3M85_01315 [Trueperella pyogenes]|uniref:hypothetical protein n=1 Tax=Trueperella pyogenes TaxID=1661 RepID=UPI00345D3DA2
MVKKIAVFLCFSRADFPPFASVIAAIKIGLFEAKRAWRICIIREGDLESDLLALFKIFALGFGVENLEA